MPVATSGTIDVYGAQENNLKNVSLHIPKKQITIFTGVSGSGKSSLCLDTIYFFLQPSPGKMPSLRRVGRGNRP
ncbi:ATP-binding cassette domain-containing protein [Sporomusa acidovorans]|uniref:UvrABC system protein A n=1 Tax=Sporomusa acidovorans (strain ATCC 49682 / DSM 3132 / Mol) TaxID=1123286 RepID=A0ABZ3J8I7_SPOA4|nr:UvrABC system protein A [Sporomusa acidovorans DSM 3132]SDE03810.1 ABC transporter [Sporomusa acidovorans]